MATRSGQRAVGPGERAGAGGSGGGAAAARRAPADAADGGDALRAAAASLASYDWVVFTSQNAVDRLMAEVRDARALAGVAVAAVGPATADALRLAGVEPDLVPAEHSARGLVEEFADGTGRVLFPCANLAPDTIAAGLGEKGWTVERVEAYRTVPAGRTRPRALGPGRCGRRDHLRRHLVGAGVRRAHHGRRHARAGTAPCRVHRTEHGGGGSGGRHGQRRRSLGVVGRRDGAGAGRSLRSPLRRRLVALT